MRTYKCKNCGTRKAADLEIINQGCYRFCSKSCRRTFTSQKNHKKAQKIKQTRARQKERKRNSIPRLKREADKWFSRYIRTRDAIKTTKTTEKGTCVTCGRVNEIKKMDCGHFISRTYTPTRWMDKNANLQCKRCNGPKAGKQYEHGIAIDKMYGKGTAQEILSVSKGVEKLTQEYLKDVIAINKQKLEEL